MKTKVCKTASFSSIQLRFGGAWRRISLALLLLMLTTLSTWADDPVTGNCGTSVTYSFDGKTLTISGAGAMADYSSSDDQPWKGFSDKIESLVIKKDVTSIGSYAFADCEYLGSVTYEAGSQLTSIGKYAFYDCYYRLASVYIPASVTSIGDDAFAYCGYLKNVFVCPETPPTLGVNVFVECGYNAKFTVRSNSYTTATGWNELSNVTVGDANGFNKPYIDADGNDAICPYAIPIPESDDAVLNEDYNFYYYNGDLWYYVSDNVNRANSLSFNQDDSFGTINIILCNNATLSVSNISSSANLSIYGQKNDEGKITGSITIESGSGSGIYAGESITINGVTIEISGSSYDSGINSYEDITINGGNISVTDATSYGIYSQSGNVTINGGEITSSATGCGIHAGNTITLGDATITASSYETYGSFKIADGLILSDGINLYSGTLTEEQIAALSTGTATTLKKLPDSFDLSATIDWDDSDQSNMRPSSVTVSLKANGVQVATCELNEGNSWNCTEEDLPSLNNGTPIVYNWELEDMPNGYKLTSNTVGTATTLTLTLQQCGDVAWSYNQISKTLTISGSGAMADYASADAQPWKDYRDEIESLVIKKGVTRIGNFAFAECTYLESVKYEAETQLGIIGSNAFDGCGSLAAVYIPSSVTAIGDNAFARCYCQNVFVCPEDAPELGENVFGEYYTSIDFIVRSNSYTTTTGWKDLSNMTVGDANNFNIPYLDAEGNKFICPYAIPISQENDYGGDNGDIWYYVSDDLTFGYLYLGYDYGTSNIILPDGVTLTINDGLSPSAKISIWRQYDENPENTPGTIMAPGLSAYAITLNGVNFESSSDFQADKGGLTINGGEINVNGVINSSGNITIKRSEITAANGISSSSNITVNGGNITIEDEGISASSNENPEGGTITINGGQITFEGNGGFSSNDIIINGSDIHITSGSFEASGGGNSERGNITITNSDIEIKDGSLSASNLTINSGEITIFNENGYGFTCGDITINDGKITVEENSFGGISATNNVIIESGEISVSGSGISEYGNGAGIYSGGSITINGGTIEATSTNGAGIASNNITLGDAIITASSYKVDEYSGSFKIADGLFMTDGSKAYSGMLYDGSNTVNGKFEDLETLNTALAGKTLQKLPDYIDLMARIVWDDYNNQYSKRPTSVTVSLMANGVKVEGATNELNETREWNCTVTNQPSLNEGELIEYTWEVHDVSGWYELSESAEATTTTFTFTIQQCGQPGSDVIWGYDPDSKTITVSGTGYMMYYNSIQNENGWSNGAPWKDFADEIETVVIENGITYVGSNTFAHCPNISSVTLPADGIYEIGPGAFADCTRLTSIDIPMSINTIGKQAFAGCSSLATVTIGYGEASSFTIDTEVFPATAVIIVPEASLSGYQTATGWSTYQIVPATRTFFAAGTTNLWMTWCDKNAYTKPEGVTVYTVSDVDDNMVTLAEVSDVIPAYTPVLLYRSTVGADVVKAVFNAVGTAPQGYNGFVETGSGNAIFLGNPGDEPYASGNNNNIYAISDFSDTQSYVLRNGNFVAVDEDGGIAPHRCWLNVTKSTTNNAPMLRISLGDATAIENYQQSTVNSQLNEWYGIDGRKLDKQPTMKGLYINNGKKYIIK